VALLGGTRLRSVHFDGRRTTIDTAGMSAITAALLARGVDGAIVNSWAAMCAILLRSLPPAPDRETTRMIRWEAFIGLDTSTLYAIVAARSWSAALRYRDRRTRPRLAPDPGPRRRNRLRVLLPVRAAEHSMAAC
jgi:hypothetical protein